MIPPPPSIIHNTKHSRTQCFISIFFQRLFHGKRAAGRVEPRLQTMYRSSSGFLVKILHFTGNIIIKYHFIWNYPTTSLHYWPNAVLLRPPGAESRRILLRICGNITKKYHIFLTRWFLMNNNYCGILGSSLLDRLTNNGSSNITAY